MVLPIKVQGKLSFDVSDALLADSPLPLVLRNLHILFRAGLAVWKCVKDVNCVIILVIVL